MKKVPRFILYTLCGLVGLVMGVVLITLAPVDRTPYQQMPYYARTKAYIDSLPFSSKVYTGENLKVGWARRSLLPDRLLPLAGYGVREGKLMEGIRDTIGVRAFVLDNGKQRIAMLSADLLIIPLQVSQQLEMMLPEIGFSMDRVFMSSTHTHGSIGAWDPGIVGELFAGTYQASAVELICTRILEAIQAAEQHLSPAKVGYGQAEAAKYVYNRLVGAEGIEDPWLRMLVFEQSPDSTGQPGRKAIWLTYAAHATVFSDREMRLHQDYPGALIRRLEALPDIDFVVYAAGAVGSHGPEGQELEDEMQMNRIADGLFNKGVGLLDSMTFTEVQSLRMLRVPVYLRSPHLRLSENWRIRPWIFERLVGKHPAHILALKIGNIVLLGTPCDFSGELIPELKYPDRFLMVSSFNGDYIGYITHDKWYELDTYETRTMNWFGPYNGAYFVEIMNRIVEKL